MIIGSVDDGKSTLIGRLLHETKSIFEDHLQAAKKFSSVNREQELDYSLFTDGLKAEREQGITIDVAYRYFSTPRRRFIIADTPGHEQYTRNMATGASTATVSLILVDAARGVTTQTKRHAFISALLGIRHFVVAINKMDLVEYSQARYDAIVNQFLDFSEKLNVEAIQFIPVSALLGDNITEKSNTMSWYEGPSVLHYLESIHIPSERNLIDFRFPVQYVNWSGSGRRGYSGTIAAGVIRPGEEILVLPTGKKTTIKRIQGTKGELSYAFASQAVTLYLTDELDISRGDMITRPKNPPCMTGEIEANLVWFDEEPMGTGDGYLIKHTTKTVKGRVSGLKYLFDPEDLHRIKANSLELNQIGKVLLTLAKPIFVDLYNTTRQTGCFILIDPRTNRTVAAGMITRCRDLHSNVKKRLEDTARGRTGWFVGDAGKEQGYRAYLDNIEAGVPAVFVDEDLLLRELRDLKEISNPVEKAIFLAGLCRILNARGFNVIVAMPDKPGNEVRAIIGEANLDINVKP